jgi:hypothetical protein
MEREDSGRQAARCGEDAAPEQSAWTILRQLEELGGEWCGGREIGRQAMVLGRGAARHRVSAARSVVTVEHAAAVQAYCRFESGCGRNGDSRGK